ncbi:hypothetical protein CASFOL_037485 [Castilleja foliolosa]|uniref:C2 domain-containing protein n=1 Tax=Castilleja foliolosa TaxID=1961234 RepID=A0ABD3BMF6_9LAMI
MEKPSSKVIEITVISAEGLLDKKRKPTKKPVSVSVRTGPFISRSTGQADPDGPGSCLSWNEKMVMDLPMHARFITVEACSGGRVIGAANIPVTDFDGGRMPENYLCFLSYRLRDGGGGKNGIINLSVKVIKGSSGGDRGCAVSCARPWMGVPAADNKMSGGVVTGIPVQYRY